MLLEHRGKAPQVDPSAYVAPTTVLCGAVTIGPDARILFGAIPTAEDGAIEAGCFIATGAALFPGARLGSGSEVRIHGVVQVNTVLAPGSLRIATTSTSSRG